MISFLLSNKKTVLFISVVIFISAIFAYQQIRITNLRDNLVDQKIKFVNEKAGLLNELKGLNVRNAELIDENTLLELAENDLQKEIDLSEKQILSLSKANLMLEGRLEKYQAEWSYSQEIIEDLQVKLDSTLALTGIDSVFVDSTIVVYNLDITDGNIDLRGNLIARFRNPVIPIGNSVLIDTLRFNANSLEIVHTISDEGITVYIHSNDDNVTINETEAFISKEAFKQYLNNNNNLSIGKKKFLTPYIGSGLGTYVGNGKSDKYFVPVLLGVTFNHRLSTSLYYGNSSIAGILTWKF